MTKETTRDTCTPEELEKHIDALNDSVAIIDADVDAGIHTDEIDARVWRNWKHIEIMLATDFIVDSNEDVSAFEAAIVKGSEFAPSEPTT